MTARFLNLASKYGVSMGDIQKEWGLSKLDAKPKRLKPGTPKFYQFVFARLEERVKAIATQGLEEDAPHVPPDFRNQSSQPLQILALPSPKEEHSEKHEG